ncbi:MAG: divalent-cation tolerance protein CutA [bacterium]
MKAGKIVVLITTGSEEEAERIARALLEERLIACANWIPKVRSLYWWQGRLNEDQETLLLCKTRESLFSRLAERTKALHSYEVPEIISLPLRQGWDPYLSWIESETVSGSAPFGES